MILRTVKVSTDFSDFSTQKLGQLNTSYVQTNSEVSPQIYATLKTPSAYIPVSVQLACLSFTAPLAGLICFSLSHGMSTFKNYKL